MKEQIAQTALELLRNGKKNKLTVKDIVDECNITRQSFYYHFDDVPQLFEWIIRKESDKLLSYSTYDVEQGIRLFLVSAVNVIPYIRKCLQTNYRDEFEHIISQAAYDLFDKISEMNGYYSDRSVREISIIRRYHCQAIIGILREWTDKDTDDLDNISHIIYLIITGQIRM